MRYYNLVELYERLEKTTKRLEKTFYIYELLKKTPTEDLHEIMLLLQGKVFPSWDSKVIGFASRLMVKAIYTATGISTREIEDQWRKTGDLGLTAEKLIARKKQRTLASGDLTVQKVFSNLRKLPEQEGAGSVEKKVRLVSELLTAAKPLEAKYIVRTVLEEMRVGVGAGSIRDAIVWAFFEKEFNLLYDNKDNLDVVSNENRAKFNELVEAVQHSYDITNDFSAVAKAAKEGNLKSLERTELKIGKPIKVMLFQKAEDIDDAFERVGKPAAFEYKYDGFRCISGYTSLYTKNKGFISVRDVNKGDYVLTHKGKFRRVLAINKRKIDNDERLFKITTFYGDSFKISEKHPILVFRNKPCWVNVEKIKVDEKVIFPIPLLKAEIPFNKELNLIDESGYSKTINVNNFFFRFLGYWIGDGYTNEHHNTERVGLIFNASKDKNQSDYYEEGIKKFFKIKNVSRNMHNGAIYLYWRDKPLRVWLSTYFRREWKGKMLPPWFAGIKKNQFEEFLRGWTESDGHIDKKGRISISTKERDLAMFASLLGLKFKIMIGLRKVGVNNKTYYKLIIPKSDRGFIFRKNEVLLNIYSIKEIKNRDSRTVLYNLQVEGDESYCTSMICLHNCQIHGNKEGIKIFTRRLEDVTHQFPDVVDTIKKSVKSKNYVIDCEVIGIDPKTKAWLPFQSISQRIKRKYDIGNMVRQVPAMVNVFDAIVVDNASFLKEPFKKRRDALKRIIKPIAEEIQLAKQIITSDKKEAEDFYKEALAKGNEGLMAKNLEAEYKPGSRVGYGVKIKPTLENLDLVITGADWGEGKRAHWLSSFAISCLKGKGLLEVGKVGTGIKELEQEGVTFMQLTQLLKPLIIEEKGKEVKVKPKLVVEVTYGEIQKSPTYSSGYALRFPRVIRLREDKPVSECSTINDIERIYKKQRK